MPKIDLFLFDLDGTLIDSKEDIANSVHYTMDALGLPRIDDDIIYSFVGHGVMPLIRQSLEAAAPEKLAELSEEKALSIFRKHYDAHCTDKTYAFDGVLEVLNRFQDRPKVVVTNKSQGFSEKIIAGLKLAPFFKGIYGGDTSFPKKPDPSVVIHLLARFHANPKKTVIIGDSHVDIDTGKNAGILTCGVTYGFRPRKELEDSKPDFLVDSIQEIIRLFS